MSCIPQENVAASPKIARSTSVAERRPFAPVTPQRNNRANRMRVASSPLTPSYSTSSVISSPFTPITNVCSSSSSLVSPDSSVSTKVGFSPEPIKSRRKSIADSTHNWRSRAKENGIKVDSDEFSYVDSFALKSPKDSVPVPFLSTHRRSRQALFQASSTDATAFISPATARLTAHDGAATAPLPSSLASSVLNSPESTGSLSSSFTLATPSPRSSHAIVQRLRQRGSLTDPARTRKRHISGPILGEALFDIDEDSISTSPFPETFGSPINLRYGDDSFNAKAKRCVSAPFIAARFYESYQDEEDCDELEDDGLPIGPKSSRGRTQSVSSQPTVASTPNVSDENRIEHMCSVCSASSSPLSVLIPCEHLICSSCLTSSLNIVGEKDIRCASCDRPVEDFKLLTPLNINTSISEHVSNSKSGSGDGDQQTIHLLPSAIENLSLNHSVGAMAKEKSTNEYAIHRNGPTPVHLASNEGGNAAVLRIDNVPWDVTPISLNDFFSPHAIIRAHVLLDPKGKTLSHAYVEVPAASARNALRSVQNKSLGKGRRLRGVTVTMSGQSELMRALFPSWLGGFDGTHPTLDGLDRAAMVRTFENGLITLLEIDGLVALMKNPKSHFLKVPSLPFHSLSSILSKFPVEGDNRVFWSAKLRDALYELANAACYLLAERIGGDYHDQHTLETVVSTAINCRLFTGVQRLDLFRKISEAVAAKGGQLSCVPPNAYISSTAQSDDGIIPDDSASSTSVSTVSIRGGRKQHNLGYGSPPVTRQNAGAFGYTGSVPFSASGQSSYTGLASPHMINASTALAFPNASMNGGLPFSINGTMHAPYDMLAREFNVDPDLVVALAQRLAYAGQTISPQAMGAFAYVQGGM